MSLLAKDSLPAKDGAGDPGVGDLLRLAAGDQLVEIPVEHDKVGRLARLDGAADGLLAYRAGAVDGVGIQHLVEGDALAGPKVIAALGRMVDPGGHIDEGARIAAVDRRIAASHQNGPRLA